MQIDRKATAVQSPEPQAKAARRGRVAQGLLDNALVLALALAAAAVAGFVRFLPAYDYPHWIYQAHVLANMADYEQWFEVVLGPIPNLASTIFLWPLTLVFSAEVAGRILISLYAFATVLSFAYLVKGKNATSGLLLLGPVLIYNYFFYNGFLSYFLGLPVVLFTIGYFERTARLTPGRWVVLTLLSVLAYMCHLFVWFPVLVYAGVAGLLSGHVRSALVIWATQLPSVVLLGVYTLTRTSSEPLRAEFYQSIPDKVFGLITPMLPLSRVDPFPPRLPFLPLNALFAVFIAVLLFVAARRFLRGKPDRAALVLPLTVLALLVIAVLMPIDWFAGMRAFDKRITFMGFALLLAAMGRYVPQRWTTPVALVAAAVLGLHFIIFSSTNGYMTTIHRALQDRPQGATLHVVTLRNPPMYAACTPGPMNLGHGVFPLQWFPLFDVVERDNLEVETFETAVLRERPDSTPGVTFTKYDNDSEYRAFVESLPQSAPAYEYMVIYGCPRDLEKVSGIWTAGPSQMAQPVNQGTYHVLLAMN